MNQWVGVGRLTKDPDVRYTVGDNPQAVARYTLAVGRRKKDEADFIPCVAFGKSAEFANTYLRQGMKMIVSGEIRTGSYTNKEGRKVYTTEVIINNQEFAESKHNSEEQKEPEPPTQTAPDDFVTVSDYVADSLPFL